MSTKFVHYKVPTVNKTACGLDIMRSMGTTSSWEQTTCEWCQDKKPKKQKLDKDPRVNITDLQLYSMSLGSEGEGTGWLESVPPVE